MIIRKIIAADIESIVNMRMRMLAETTDEKIPGGLDQQIRRFVRKHMKDGTCMGVLAEKDGQVIADAVIYLFETMPDEINMAGRTAMLYNVYTVPEFRGQGIMAQMLPEVIKLAREAGAVELKMTAAPKAIPLYERMGFRVNEDAMKMVL